MKLSKIGNWFKSNTIRYFYLDEWKDNNGSENFSYNHFNCYSDIQYGDFSKYLFSSKWNIPINYYTRLFQGFCRYYRQDFQFKKQESSKFNSNSGTNPFFRWEDKYQQHSKDLVDALKTWADSIIFPYCEYIGGCLRKYDYSNTIKEIDIPLLKQAKDHLEKSYPTILKMHENIKNNCTKLCEQIQEVIKAKYQPSFEHIITVEIYLKCPKLKIIHKNNVIEYSKQFNIYTDNDIFDIIFKNQLLDVNDLQIKGDKLIYQNFSNIAKGEKSELETLKQVLLKLTLNKDIKKLVEEYHNLHDELENQSDSFKKEIINLYNLIHGGKKLETSKDCEICQSFSNFG
jgi:hypothetical protein